MQILNTLYITTQGSYLRQDHMNFVIKLDEAEIFRVPFHQIGDVVLMGRVVISPSVVATCAENGIALTFLSESGAFHGQLRPPTSGNVLLRLEQYAASIDDARRSDLARNFVAGKINNSRNSLLRSARDSTDAEESSRLREAAQHQATVLKRLKSSENLDRIRGYEGEAAAVYFGVLPLMIRTERESYGFDSRNRRPPRDAMNALLSYLYTILLKDCIAAVDAVGLDPQLGFLHAPRPGKPSLGLDLMEELRPVFADRLAFSLINRRQIVPNGFTNSGGVVLMNEKTRKTVVVSYQKRKKEEIEHPLLKRKVPFGLIPHVQAKLLARSIREEIQGYPPFIYR